MNVSREKIGRVQAPAWLKPVSRGGREVLDLLLKRGRQSQAEITTIVDISQPSVARLVGSFEADGLIRLSERRTGGRGNPSMHVELNPDFAYSLGIGMVGDAIAMTVLDLVGNVRASKSVAMKSMSRAAVIKRMVALKSTVLTKAEIPPRRLVGAGVGFSGFFVEEPLRFNPPEQLRDWADVDVAAVLEEALGLPVTCDNDGTVAAVAENFLGIGKTCPTFAYCHLTNGFGGGLIDSGRALRGARGNAGDFGGVLWLLDDGYPNLDSLRTCISRNGIDFETVEDMVHAIDPQTPGVAAWIDTAKRPIAKLAFLLGHIVAPEKVVIGGRLPHSVSKALAAAIELPKTPTRNDKPFPLPQVVASEVQGDAVSIGAAAMPLQQLFFG